MIDENRYYTTFDTRLAAALEAAGVSHFLQIDQNRSAFNRVYLVLTNPQEAEKFATKFSTSMRKLTNEIDLFKRGPK